MLLKFCYTSDETFLAEFSVHAVKIQEYRITRYRYTLPVTSITLLASRFNIARSTVGPGSSSNYEYYFFMFIIFLCYHYRVIFLTYCVLH